MLARRILAASGGVVSGLDPDAQAVIAAMTTAPDAARQQLISDHIVALKAAGIWSQLDVYYVMAAHHEQASRLNWKSPGDFTLTTNGTITFTVDQGWQGDGSTGYIDTGWIPSTHGVNYTLNDASFGVYSRTSIDTTAVDAGTWNSSSDGVTYLQSVTSSEIRARVHFGSGSIGQAATSNTSSLGFFVARRSGETSLEALKNGAIVATGTRESFSLPAKSFFVGSINNTLPLGFNTRQYSAFFTAAAMTTTQQADLYTALQTGYLAGVGAAV